MAVRFSELKEALVSSPKKWLVTGAAGFIGSSLIETLLRLDQHVVGVDNFVTGYKKNLDDVRRLVGEDSWRKFSFLRGDVADEKLCQDACAGVHYVLHQAAIGSVPRSFADPCASNRANVDGFLSLLVAAKQAGVRRFVYASSSSVYGDDPRLPKREEEIGAPLSPYAVTKRVNELYAHVFSDVLGVCVVGLRYFNVFGARQDPQGAYAAVIPRWLDALLNGEECVIYGDGKTSRDFCYIANVVQANLLAACAGDDAKLRGAVLNIAVGGRTTLAELYDMLRHGVEKLCGRTVALPLRYEDFRVGDVAHSLADISKARDVLGYEPTHDVPQGIEETIRWYAKAKQS